MQFKRWFIWLCLVLLLSGEIFLFVANRQKDAAQTALAAAQLQVAQLRAELDQYQSSNVVVRLSDLERLRRENSSLSASLSAVQGAITNLQSTNTVLATQLYLARHALGMQQQHLQELQTENQEVRAVAGSAVDDRNTCIDNLREIEAAKQQWALENDKSDAAIPGVQDLLPYLRDNVFPACPAGGIYVINAVGIPATCSVTGHTLP